MPQSLPFECVLRWEHLHLRIWCLTQPDLSNLITKPNLSKDLQKGIAPGLILTVEGNEQEAVAGTHPLL